MGQCEELVRVHEKKSHTNFKMSAFFRIFSLLLCNLDREYDDIVESLSYTLVPDEFFGRTFKGLPQTCSIGYR